jgi:hypothetical protein
VAGVGSWNDWQKEKQFLRLQAESEKDNTVSLIPSPHITYYLFSGVDTEELIREILLNSY